MEIFEFHLLDLDEFPVSVDVCVDRYHTFSFTIISAYLFLVNR